jgi:ribosomal protein S10
MRFARDFDGFLLDAEVNNRHGNFICPQCHNLAHWRKKSVNQRRPHFYHAVANEDCPLSVAGGKWNLLENDNVEFNSELKGEQLVFQRKTKSNLSKIPSELISDSKLEKQISPSIMKIRLTSPEVGQIDSTVSLFCKILENQKVSSFCAIPLPTKIVSVQNRESPTKRIHRRLVKVIGSTPELVEKLSFLNIPENVNIELET